MSKNTVLERERREARQSKRACFPASDYVAEGKKRKYSMAELHYAMERMQDATNWKLPLLALIRFEDFDGADVGIGVAVPGNGHHPGINDGAVIFLLRRDNGDIPIVDLRIEFHLLNRTPWVLVSRLSFYSQCSVVVNILQRLQEATYTDLSLSPRDLSTPGACFLRTDCIFDVHVPDPGLQYPQRGYRIARIVKNHVRRIEVHTQRPMIQFLEELSQLFRAFLTRLEEKLYIAAGRFLG